MYILLLYNLQLKRKHVSYTINLLSYLKLENFNMKLPSLLSFKNYKYTMYVKYCFKFKKLNNLMS